MSKGAVYLFAGDSLTEGRTGESYVERVAAGLREAGNGWAGQMINAGRGADTLKALLARIDEPLARHRPDWVILAIGTNDVWLPWLAEHSLIWRLHLWQRQLLFGQVPTTDLDEFAARYRELIDRVRAQANARAVACTPSVCGERLATPVNRQMARMTGVIKRVTADCQVPVADVWQAFVDELAPLPRPSNYVPGEWLFTWLDRKRLEGTSPDELSRRRRLVLTCDGIHLNSRGADLWARTILRTLAVADSTLGVTDKGQRVAGSSIGDWHG